MKNKQILVLALLTLPVELLAQEIHSVAEAEKMERQVALPATALYSTQVTSATHPGDLLGQEPVTGYELLPGVKAVRIVYHSLDATGRDVATTAAVLLPPGSAPSGGWPVIAWAHGTSGVAQQCAPSLMKDLEYADEGLKDMLQAGFAIVATDYAGLGTAEPHQWVDKKAQAHDVIYSLPAARKAVPSLGARWVVDGHSQGGLTAWGVGELESSLDDPGFLGAVSVSGAIRLEQFLDLMDHTQGGLTMYVAYMAWALHARYPDSRPEDLLTGEAMQRYPLVTTKGCWDYGYASFEGMPQGGVLKRNWRQNPYLQRFAKENALASLPVRKPLLVLAGEADLSVPISGVRETVARACRNGTALTFKSYPGLDHDPTMSKSTPDQLAWIRDRFAGKAASSNCPP